MLPLAWENASLIKAEGAEELLGGSRGVLSGVGVGPSGGQRKGPEMPLCKSTQPGSPLPAGPE